MNVETHQYQYGPHPSQTVRLFLPTGAHLPVAVVIHGGYWRSTYGMELAEPLGRDLTRFGVAAAVIEYRRVGEGGAGRRRWPTPHVPSIPLPVPGRTWRRVAYCSTGSPPSGTPPADTSRPGSPTEVRSAPVRPVRWARGSRTFPSSER